MAPAKFCKTCKKSKKGETRGKTNDFKSKFACILEASETTRMRMEESLPNYHEDHIARRADNSLQQYNLVHKFSYASSNEDTRSKSSSGQGMGKIGENFGVELDESQKQIRRDRWSMDEGQKSSFCLTDGQLSFEECRIGGRAPKRWFWILCSIHWTRIISITNDGSKSHGYHIQIARVRRTSSWRSLCLYSGKNSRCSKIIEKFPNRNIQWFGFVYHDTNGQNHGPVWKMQSFLLNEICMVSFGRTVMEKAIWENPIEVRLGEGFQLGMLTRTPWKKDYSYLCMWTV